MTPRRGLVAPLVVALALTACTGGAPAELALAREPEGDDRQLELLVKETACASGRSAEGRIDVQDVEVTDDELRLHITVRALRGDQDCQGNPWTPFTLQLDDDVAGRSIVNVGVTPRQELSVVDTRPADRTVEEAIELALSWTPPATYVLVLETSCFCPELRSRIEVVDGDVVLRSPADGDPAADVSVGALLAPSLQELLERIRTEPETVSELVVEDTGELRFVAFDPMPDAIDDEIAFSVESVEVDEGG